MIAKWSINRFGDMYEMNVETSTGYMVIELNADDTKFDDRTLSDSMTTVIPFTYRENKGIVVQSEKVTNSFTALPDEIYISIVNFIEKGVMEDYEFSVV
jgi:hypothetical protein